MVDGRFVCGNVRKRKVRRTWREAGIGIDGIFRKAVHFAVVPLGDQRRVRVAWIGRIFKRYRFERDEFSADARDPRDVRARIRTAVRR